MTVYILLRILILFNVNVIDNFSYLNSVLTNRWLPVGSFMLLLDCLGICNVLFKILLLCYNHKHLLNLTHVLRRAPYVLDDVWSYLVWLQLWFIQQWTPSLPLQVSLCRNFTHVWRVYHGTQLLLISKASSEFIFILFMWAMMDALLICYFV